MKHAWNHSYRTFAILLAVLLASGCASRTDLPTGGAPESSAPRSASESVSQATSAPDIKVTERSESRQQQPESSSSEQASSAVPDQNWRDIWELRLVNEENPLAEDYEPELATVQNGHQMDARVAPYMLELLAAAQADGVDLMVISAYRPYARQASNFERHVQGSIASGYSEAKAREIARKWIAYPGTSEHQAGLCADIVTPTYTALDEGYANTTAAKWLLENAADFGFVLRYPKDKTEITTIAFEPWHYRYVGKEHAPKIMDAGVCLEEYLAEPKQQKAP